MTEHTPTPDGFGVAERAEEPYTEIGFPDERPREEQDRKTISLGIGGEEPTEEDVVEFITQTMRPALQEIADLREHIGHKYDLFQLGMKLSTLRDEVSRWLPEAQRLITIDIHDETERAYQSRITEKQKVKAAELLPVDVTKTSIKERVKNMQRAVDLLRNVREDLGVQISFTQTAMNAISKDEFSIS